MDLLRNSYLNLSVQFLGIFEKEKNDRFFSLKINFYNLSLSNSGTNLGESGKIGSCLNKGFMWYRFID